MPRVNRAKLEELRALRQSGKKTFDTYKVENVDELYEEVDEDRYKKIVRDRLNQDDFVVDDNGEGYADDGREEWDRVHHAYDSESEDEVTTRGRPSKNAKKQKDAEQARRDANDRDISQYFNNGTAKAQPKPKVAKTKDDDDFLANLLGEVDANVPAPAPRSKKRDRVGERRRSPLRDIGLPAAKKTKTTDTRLPSPSVDFTTSDAIEDSAPLMLDQDEPLHSAAPSSPCPKAAEPKVRVKMEDEEEEDVLEVAHAGALVAASVNITGSRPPKKQPMANPYPSPVNSSPPQKASEPQVDASAWNKVTENLNVVSNPETKSFGKLDYKDAIEEDGSVNMFWTDYTELNGSLYLFGKVQNKKTKVYVSCFVKVDNILRKLYFLPRENRVRGGQETDEAVGMAEVYGEVDEIMTKMGVAMHKIKACTRKYAFELADIPREAQYLKLLYPYSKPAIDMGTTGETFSHVFGTNTSLFEQFVLWKSIMGPCWLNIRDADFTALNNMSHCKLEVLVKDPDTVLPVSDSENMETPPLTLMSLALRTAFNAKANKQEILAISARIYENMSLSDTTPADRLPCRTFTLVRPHGSAYPMGFEQLVKGRKKGMVKTTRQEAELLSVFLAQLDVADPDVLIGHQLEGVDFSILLNRLHEKKVPQWHRIGRLRRQQWPAAIAKVGGNVFAERQMLCGRLLCDLSNDAGKSTMYKCQSWSLTEMCSLYLPGDNNRRRDVDNEAALKTWAGTKDGLMDYLTHLEADTYFIAALALQVQMLPLTKVLTNLAGNSWARTLTGTRAERNEYILLHEFHKNKYICPDKQTFRGRQQQKSEEENDGGNDGKKVAKYEGGLVFEPKRGLYDKFVLVMDFNSLYPSIIQEFNICFTTVERMGLAQDAVPEVPDADNQGILPKLISTLVSRRRQVKALMKDKAATAEQLATWDIKQLALKLTANSMYGCLGYTKSRFYARPLAVLTTSKGREILMSTKDLAESKALEVIYGDTDSVMINANVESVGDALRVGHEFKKAVNERYRLLEIDIDNVFRRILLQAKKKYAAINLVEQEGKWTEKMEVKGLDMKRREYCALSKEISNRILQEILSGNETEASVAQIHEYLREISAKMREQAVPVQKYIIFTQLGKAPKEYPNADSMPQVQVALREMAKGKTVRKGDVIAYIITGDSGSSEAAPKRAYAPGDVKPDSGLAPDVEWYIGKQIFPPVERLCANIGGTSTPQLAEQLGLDIKKYSSFQGQGQGGPGDDLEVHPLESQMPDEVRFSDCSRLSLRCRRCRASTVFEGLLARPDAVTASGIACGSCKATMPALSVLAQVEHALRSETARYHEGWLVCDDSSCGIRTRQMSVYGTRCLGPKGLARDCLGRMRYEYGEKAVYNQLVYFSTLFDVDKAKERASAPGFASSDAGDREKILALAEHNRARFGTVRGVVDRYLDKCGRQWVAMDSLFAKLGFVKA